MNKTYIYILKDIDNPKIAYIGKSNNPELRFRDHVGDSVNQCRWHERNGTLHEMSDKKIWLYEKWKLGRLPRLDILEQCDQDVWRDREIYWINKLLSSGSELKNTFRWHSKGKYRLQAIPQKKCLVSTLPPMKPR